MFRPLDDRQRCSRVVVGLILLVALGVRIGWAIGRPVEESALTNLPDQIEYLSLARSLKAGEGLSMVDPRFRDTVLAFRMPGYPLFCAVLNADVRWIRIGQSIVDTSSVLAALWLARRWLSPILSYLAAGFVALDPIQVYFSSLVLSETLFTAFIAWGVACLAHGRSPMARGHGAGVWWTGIGLLVLSIYIRPSAVLWPMVLAGASVVHEHGMSSFKPARRVPVLMLVALITAIALLPWAIRNRSLLGSWIWTTTNSGVTLYDSWNRDSNGQSDQSHLARLPLLPGLNEVQRSEYLRSVAWESARRDPQALLVKVPTNLARLWTPWPLSQEFGSKRLYVIGAAAHAIPLFLLALLGLVKPGLPAGAKLLLITPAILVTIAHGMTIGSLRYRMPIHPELGVLAAAALVRRARVVTDTDVQAE